jgi:hypothetical protein
VVQKQPMAVALLGSLEASLLPEQALVRLALLGLVAVVAAAQQPAQGLVLALAQLQAPVRERELAQGLVEPGPARLVALALVLVAAEIDSDSAATACSSFSSLMTVAAVAEAAELVRQEHHASKWCDYASLLILRASCLVMLARQLRSACRPCLAV